MSKMSGFNEYIKLPKSNDFTTFVDIIYTVILKL